MTKLTGDELARACADAMYKRDTAAQAVGISIAEVGEGRSRLRMTIRQDMLNGHGICHGGYIFTLADTAFAYACNSRNRINVAKNCCIEFKRPGREGDIICGSAEHLSQDGRYGEYRVTVTSQDETVIAEFTGQSCEIAGSILDSTGEDTAGN